MIILKLLYLFKHEVKFESRNPQNSHLYKNAVKDLHNELKVNILYLFIYKDMNFLQ